jgi:hypothetical protein
MYRLGVEFGVEGGGYWWRRIGGRRGGIGDLVGRGLVLACWINP